MIVHTNRAAGPRIGPNWESKSFENHSRQMA
jgi:hypothetical protein